MPGGNGTGPMGMGPMTGRGAGYCAGNQMAGYANGLPGRGRGRGLSLRRGPTGRAGRGMRFGCGRWTAPIFGNTSSPLPIGGSYGVAQTRDQEMEGLKEQAEYFQNAIESIKKRMGELDTGKESE